MSGDELTTTAGPHQTASRANKQRHPLDATGRSWRQHQMERPATDTERIAKLEEQVAALSGLVMALKNVLTDSDQAFGLLSRVAVLESLAADDQ